MMAPELLFIAGLLACMTIVLVSALVDRMVIRRLCEKPKNKTLYIFGKSNVEFYNDGP